MDLFKREKDMKSEKKRKDKFYQFKHYICNSNNKFTTQFKDAYQLKYFARFKKRFNSIARSFVGQNKHCKITTRTFLGISKSLQQYQ
jgi:hypothetical protein